VFHNMVNLQQTNYSYLFHFIIGIDFLGRLLSFDHRLRPTVEQALGKLS
jgi:hypothetical protein